MNPEDNQKPAKSAYGKRPMWQWLLLYLAVGGIVYGLIYLLFMRDGGGIY